MFQYVQQNDRCVHVNNNGVQTSILNQLLLVIGNIGIIASAWDIGSILGTIGFTYIANKGHRPRWMGFGMFLVGFSCFMKNIPYIMFGPGEIVKLYTKEYVEQFNSTGKYTPE